PRLRRRRRAWADRGRAHCGAPYRRRSARRAAQAARGLQGLERRCDGRGTGVNVVSIPGERRETREPTASAAPLQFIDPVKWDGQDVPPRQWLVADRIPMSNVTLLYGDGAVGKTTIGLQLVVATVLRLTDWLGGVIDHPGDAIFFT